MVFVEEKMFSSILGTVVEVKQMSAKARLLRKTYMGVWRWGAETMSAKMKKLPEMLIIYMSRKRRKRGICSSGWVEMPKRMKCDTLVQLLLSICHHRNGKDHFHSLGNMSKLSRTPHCCTPAQNTHGTDKRTEFLMVFLYL